MKTELKLLAMLALAIVVVVAVVAGYFAGFKSSQSAAENLSPRAAKSQADGSVILARGASASAPQAGRPKARIPSGATLERQISVTVKPRAALKTLQGAAASCPPVTVDLSLVRDGDGRRVIASSPDGEVIAGMDVPVEAGRLPVSHPWAAGVSCNVGQACSLHSSGAWVERDLGRLRAGAEVFRQADGAVQGRLRVGWVW